MEEALAALLGDRQGGDLVADLVEGAKEAMHRRQRNTMHGGLVIEALRQAGLSWREIEQRTGIPRTTAQRWAETTPTAE